MTDPSISEVNAFAADLREVLEDDMGAVVHDLRISGPREEISVAVDLTLPGGRSMTLEEREMEMTDRDLRAEESYAAQQDHLTER